MKRKLALILVAVFIISAILPVALGVMGIM